MRKTLVTFTIAISLGLSGTVANAQEAAPAGPAAQVAGVSLRAVSDPRAPTAPGRGALVHRGAARPIQIADDAPGRP